MNFLVVLLSVISTAFASGYITPYTSSISQHSSSVIHPSPLVRYAPFIHSSYHAPAIGHFIAKRSAPLLLAPTAVSHQSRYDGHRSLVHPGFIQPNVIHPHYIGKRSVGYLAPTAYSHQSRVDYNNHYPVFKTVYSPYGHNYYGNYY